MLAGLMEPYFVHTFENKKKKDMHCPLPFYIIGESVKVFILIFLSACSLSQFVEFAHSTFVSL
jgi:hypothetical protein